MYFSVLKFNIIIFNVKRFLKRVYLDNVSEWAIEKRYKTDRKKAFDITKNFRYI